MSLIGCDAEGEGLGKLLRNATDFSHLSDPQKVRRQRAGATLCLAAASETGSLRCLWMADERHGSADACHCPMHTFKCLLVKAAAAGHLLAAQDAVCCSQAQAAVVSRCLELLHLIQRVLPEVQAALGPGPSTPPLHVWFADQPHPLCPSVCRWCCSRWSSRRTAWWRPSCGCACRFCASAAPTSTSS